MYKCCTFDDLRWLYKYPWNSTHPALHCSAGKTRAAGDKKGGTAEVAWDTNRWQKSGWNELLNRAYSCMKSFVEGNNRLLGTSQVSALREARLGMSKVMVSAGYAVLSFPLKLLLNHEVWKQRASWSEGWSSCAVGMVAAVSGMCAAGWVVFIWSTW